MKKIFIIACFLFISCSLLAQNNNKRSAESIEAKTIKKWVLAVVNIQGLTSDDKYYMRLFDTLRAKYLRDEITSDEWARIGDSAYNAKMLHKRFGGSAIFLIYKNNYYLISARHVLNDTTSNTSNSIYNLIYLVDNYTIPKDFYLDSLAGVRQYDPVFLMNYPNMFYELSSTDEDLGIIKLTGTEPLQQGSMFVKALLNRGYKPIKYDDIDKSGSLSIGQPIITIGFPNESIMNLDEPKNYIPHWSVPEKTVPILSNGEISDIRKDLNEFSGDIFIYHGNSGGPVVSNDKLIGVVSGFNRIPTKINEKPKRYYLLYQSVFKQSKLLIKLLKKLDSANIIINKIK